ncbi:MAG: thioredoxin domain-containing protein [Verrucomicrobiota bacterium]
MKRFLPFIIVGLVAVATLVSGAMLYRAKQPHLLTIPHDKEVSGKSDAALMHFRGNPDAPVTLEEFGDFECPPCRNISTFLDQLAKEYDPRLRIIFRNFPLANHKHARNAALAAEAAGLQGRFWEMHDLFYREQEAWSKADDVDKLFDSYAGMIGLDIGQFKKDAGAEKAKQRVDSDQERGTSLGVKSTPTLFINNREVGPTERTPEGIRAAIDAALKASGAKPEKQ